MSHEEDPNFPGLAIKQRGKKVKIYTMIQYIKIKVSSKSKDDTKEFSILTTPGELFQDLAEILLKRSPTGEKDTFIFQCSNDWIAYLFSIREYMEQGGYEPMASFGPLCGDQVTVEMLKSFNEIKEEITFGHS